MGRTLNSKDESVARKFRGVQRGRSRSVRTLGVESDADRRRDGLRGGGIGELRGVREAYSTICQEPDANTSAVIKV